MDELKLVNKPGLNFKHSPEGVVAVYKKKKFIIGSLEIWKDNVEITNLDLINNAKIQLNFQHALKRLPKHEINNFNIISEPNITNNFTPFFKYIPNQIFDKFLTKGIWQLGTIYQYRTIENNKQRDEFEGFSLVNLMINNHLTTTICSSGFNYLIFCGTKTNNSNYHESNFGTKKLYFPNVRSFANAICKAINAKRYYIQNVKYCTLKLYINRKNNVIRNVKFDELLVPEFFDLLSNHLIVPSLFVKPEIFMPEDEVRIVFEMDRDYYKPYRFKHLGLMKLIEY